LVFTSLTFLVFYVIVFAWYWPLTRDWQNRLIVISGLIFYGWWDWRFAILLLITTGIDYWSDWRWSGKQTRPSGARG
jgi:hypothetical protein